MSTLSATERVLLNKNFLLYICSYLPIEALHTVPKVCKCWNALSKDQTKWKPLLDRLKVYNPLEKLSHLDYSFIDTQENLLHPILKIEHRENQFIVHFPGMGPNSYLEKKYDISGNLLWAHSQYVHENILPDVTSTQYSFKNPTKKNIQVLDVNQKVILNFESNNENMVENYYQFVPERNLLLIAISLVSGAECNESELIKIVSKNPCICVYELNEDKLLVPIADPKFMFGGAFFYFFRDLIFVGCDFGELKIFNLEGKLVKTLNTEHQPKPESSSIQAVHVTEDKIMAGDMSGIIHIWKFSNQSTEEKIDTAFKQKTSKRTNNSMPKPLNKRSRRK